MRRTGLLALSALIAALVLWAPPSARAQVSQEIELKAHLIFNFLLFVDWPDEAFEGPSSPLRVCVVGSDTFVGTLDAVIDKRAVKGHPVVAVRAAQPDPGSCHAIYIPGSENDRLPVITSAANRNASMLTVGDSEKSLEQGVVIGIYTDRNRLRFEINPNAAPKLRFSSKLLSLGKVYKGRR